jgi:hypothetical protein
MKEVQEVLHQIVNELEETSANLVVVGQNLEKLLGGKSLIDVAEEKRQAKKANEAFYKGIRAKINAITAVPPSSENRDWMK